MKDSDLTTLETLLSANIEWLITNPSGVPFPLRSGEIEIEKASGKVLFSFPAKNGFQTWRITGIEFDRPKIVLDLSRNFGNENHRFELIPRASAEEFSGAVEIARLKRVNNIARLLPAEFPGVKVIRAELNRENGRFAQILIENNDRTYSTVIADVSDTLSPEILLASAIFTKLRSGKNRKYAVSDVRILCEKRVANKLERLHACLNESWKRNIRLYKLSECDSGSEISAVSDLSISDLWRSKPRKLHALKQRQLSKTAAEIKKLSPGEIDHIYSKNGETLRYLGLPFLRSRNISGNEKIWFGVERARQTLDEGSIEDLYDLFEQLKKYRKHDPPNPQHLFYQMAPEAWLESLLRQNIKLLDANLILSPIYNQFRTSQDKIDLLALRKDGRLVIIELKVSADREMIFQAVDYWRKIELQRRSGVFNKAGLFGEAVISDKPAIVYLVAPTLGYHPDFDFLSKTLSTEIEIYRFDLAENWRKEIKVLRRSRVNHFARE
ncbi:MAG: hypothetical protein R2681_13215 [Pyrinomonadaceae bacterium]